MARDVPLPARRSRKARNLIGSQMSTVSISSRPSNSSRDRAAWCGRATPDDCSIRRLGTLRDGKCLQVLGLADVLIRIGDDRKEAALAMSFFEALGWAFWAALTSCLGDMSGVTILMRVSPIALNSLASMTGCPVLTEGHDSKDSSRLPGWRLK